MRISQLLPRIALFPLVLCVVALAGAQGQQQEQRRIPASESTIIAPERTFSAVSVAGNTDLYCAGFVQYAPAPINPEIVGGEQEQEKRVYAQGDYVFINAGSQQGIKVGQEFAIVRPRGQFTSKFTTKKGWLGVFMQELGRLSVVNVKERVSVAVITNSCDTVLLGDLLRQTNNRVSPTQRAELNLDRFAEPTGKQRGRIVHANLDREMVSRNHIVYIDLGAEDNVKAGDYLTIYRPVGTGNITRIENEEIARARNKDFGSDRFGGGEFSLQSQRVKDYSNTPGLFFKDEPLTTTEIKRKRPPLPRKVIGELVILSVQTRTATAIITRVAQEIHTGDFVEVQ